MITLNELTFSAYTRCKCGVGMAYINDRELRKKETGDCWVCSDLLLKDLKLRVKREGGFFGGGIIEDENGTEHTQSYPFVSYEIKSENQPSANGATTRPNDIGCGCGCGIQPCIENIE
jgi:hypothetical protein